MGFWNRVKALFGGDGKPPKSAGGLLAGILSSGNMPRRGTKELLLAYSRLPYVHSVVKRIAQDVAGVPLVVYRSKGARAKVYRSAGLGHRKAALAEGVASGELEALERHPFLDLWATWNPALGGHASRFVMQVWLDLVGEGFQVLERNAIGQPLELWPVPPHWIVDTPSAPSPFFRASFGGWNRKFPESEVNWLRMLNPENPYARGTGQGEALGDELDVDEMASKVLRNWFFNSAIPPAIVNLPEMGDAERERFKHQLFRDHSGPNRQDRVMVTNVPNIDVKTLAQTFKEQELTALRRDEREIVVQAFNVPPECLGIIENSNRSTIDAAHYLYTSGVLCPRLDFLASAMQPVLDAFGDELVLGYDSPVEEDKEFRRQVYLQAPPGTFTRNEYRALASEPPVEEEEKPGEPIYQYHLSFGIVTINEARARLGLPAVDWGNEPPKPPDLFGGVGGEEMAARPRLLKASSTSRLDPLSCPACGAEARTNIDCAECMAAPATLSLEQLQTFRDKVDDLSQLARADAVAQTFFASRRLTAGARKASIPVDSILEQLRPERLSAEADPVMERQLAKWGNRVLADLGLSLRFDLKNPKVRQHLEEFSGTKIRGINDTTLEALRSALSEGVAAGEGIRELAGRVTEVFDAADKVRARRIARTEVVGSSNFGNLVAFEMSGIVPSKEWLSVRDGNTRLEHQELDGQLVGVTESFVVPGTGERTQYPGGFGVAALDINCRCSVLPVVEDPGKAAGVVVHRAMTEEEKTVAWKRYDRRLGPWERAAAEAFRKGFREQEADILEALEKLA